MPNGSNNFALPVPGPQGPAGATGAQGPQGDPGETGPQGPAGVVAASAPVTYDAETQTIGIDVGSTAGTVCAGDDSRLSDTRDPNAHTHPQSDIDNLESDLAGKLSASVLAVSAGYVPYFDGTNLIDSLISQAGSTISVAGLVATAITLTNTSGATAVLSLAPTYNQATGTAANTDLRINRTQTAVGSGTQRFIDCQIAGTSYLYATANTTTSDLVITNASGSMGLGVSTGGGGWTAARGGHSFGCTIQNPLLTGDTTNFVMATGGASGGRKGFAWQARNAASVITTLGFNGEGMLGIGTTNPLYYLHVVGNTYTNTSGSIVHAAITPTYNQASGTAANTDLLINRTSTAVGSGAQLLIDAQVGGSSRFRIDTSGNIVFASLFATGTTLQSGSSNTPITFQNKTISSASNNLNLQATVTSTSGTTINTNVVTTYNQTSGTGANTDLLVSRFVTGGTGSGTQRFFDCQLAGVSQFSVSVGGKITSAATSINVATQTPASASATGTTGDIAWDANYIYVCTATNTWKRAALATW